ncbi:isobutylamine N-hydroxylase [Rhodococcus opacus M213]|uniref:Isobutylamine N-hydroxylase n=2 Tax=Rhodococcus opacus TaxID=37919 RepID=K8XI43_RHOOP|nr:isobutylamine N-hydroxylase [Rhodococcus opacus M213]GLK34612.1 hypothetical protein GCM10017611_14600 [Rhodococcus wratislaviensis]
MPLWIFREIRLFENNSRIVMTALMAREHAALTSFLLGLATYLDETHLLTLEGRDSGAIGRFGAQAAPH